MNKPSIVFLGTPYFVKPVRDALLSAGYPLIAEVPPQKDIPKADIFVIAAYGKILTPKILAKAKLGVLNVHPSLLPKYRGPSPVQSAILAGETETGVTIMLTDEKIDHGSILAQTKVSIDPNDTSASLLEKLFLIGAALLIETIPRWVAGKIEPKAQNHALATYTKLLTKDSGRIDWSQNAEIIIRHIRAMTPWPSAWTVYNKKRIKILAAHVGSVKLEDFIIPTADKLLIIDMMQPEGGKPMTGREFVRGYLKNTSPQ